MDPTQQPEAAPRAPSLTHTAARGVAWTSAVTLLERIAALVTQFLLAALLSLETWGAWGIITSIALFFSGFASTGVREVLIHRSASFRLWCGPALWFAGAWGLLLSALTAAAALPVSFMVNEDYRAETVLGILVVAPTPLMMSIFSVPRAKMAIEHRFKEAALIYALPGIGQLLLTLILAFAGMRIMAFAIPYTLAMLARVVIMLWIAKVPLTARPRIRSWKYFVPDAARVWVETTAVWMRSQGDVLIVGLFADQASVGLYTFARNMSRQMVSLFTQQVASVMQPMLVTLRETPARLLAAFMRATRLLAFLGVPMTLGIAAVMWPAMPLILDENKWAELPLVLTLMTVGIALRVLTESAVSLKFALGRFRQQQRFSIVSSIFFGAAVGVGAWLDGALGASAGFAVFCAGAGPLQFLTAIQPVGGGWKHTYQAVLQPALLATAAIAPWVVLAEWLGHQSQPAQALMATMVIAGSALTYFVLAMALRLPELRELAERLREQSPTRFRPLVARLTQPMMVRGGPTT